MSSIEPQVEAIVDTILEDYRNGRAIDKIDHFRHPDKEIVTDMIGKLMRIVYPGATREKAYRIYNARHNLSMLIEDVMYNLNKQLTLPQMLTIVLTATLASIGTAGVPGAGMVMLAMVLTSVGLPVDGIALVAGVDRIFDMGRTTVNITGDAACAIIVSHVEEKKEQKLAAKE